MLNDNVNGYGLISIVLHWVSAVMIVALFFLGLFMVDLDYQSPWYHRAPILHTGFGLCLLCLMSLRLVWRLSSGVPDALPNPRAWQKKFSTVIKILLFVAVFMILISGYFIASESTQGPSFFDWLHFPVLINLSSGNVDWLGEGHELLAFFVIFIATLHAGAALVHHYFYGDNTLRRMIIPVAKTKQ